MKGYSLFLKQPDLPALETQLYNELIFHKLNFVRYTWMNRTTKVKFDL